MRDLEDEERIKAYMKAKMAHIKMYNECMNLADGLDVEKFAELVRADEREECAKICDAQSIKQQPPIAWMGTDFEGNPTKFRLNSFSGSFPLYTAPPKREWVGLTEDEVLECFDSVALGAVEKENVIDKRVNIFNAIKAIEAKLKEKNGG